MNTALNEQALNQLFTEARTFSACKIKLLAPNYYISYMI